MNKSTTAFALGIILLLGAIVIGIFLAWPIQWLWNSALVGSIDGINQISFWQSYCIYILSTIMFRTNSLYSPKQKQ
jgi:hypothetical protein